MTTKEYVEKLGKICQAHFKTGFDIVETHFFILLYVQGYINPVADIPKKQICEFNIYNDKDGFRNLDDQFKRQFIHATTPYSMTSIENR